MILSLLLLPSWSRCVVAELCGDGGTAERALFLRVLLLVPGGNGSEREEEEEGRMACVQIRGSGLSPLLRIRPVLPRRRLPCSAAPFRCRLQEDDNSGSNGEEPPESLFMKELKRRGMTPTSLLEEGAGGRGAFPGRREEVELEQEKRSGDGGHGRGQRKRNGVVSADYEKGMENQRERSMALNSEGLEGLIPRAKLLLTLGGTFFLGFWPLMLITIGFFAALYFYFGASFVHDASKMHISPPQYVDPRALTEDERASQAAPRLS